MNKKGIILSSLIYILLVFFLLLLASIMAVLWSRQVVINNVKDQADNIFNPKPDTDIPVITMKGSSPVTVTLNTTYTDAGATATDETDGDLSFKIQTASTVNTSVAGTYTVTYDVYDSSGNFATPVVRTVTVQ